MRMITALALLTLAGCAGPRIQVAQPPPVPPVREVAMNDQLVEKARAIVREDFESDNPLRRANAIEAAESLPPDEAQERLTKALYDEDARVRFAATMSIGRRQIDSPEIRERLIELTTGQSPNGQVAALFALHELGDRSRSQQLAEAAQSPDPVVRANTAIALGLTGEPTAKRVLRPMLIDSDGNVRLNAAEAMWRLGDEQGFKSLLASTLNKFKDDRVIGTLGLSAHRDPTAAASLYSKLTDEDPEVALAAARGLGRFGMDTGYGVAMKALQASQPTANDAKVLKTADTDSEAYFAARGRSVRRVMAAMALGDIGRTDAQPLLAPLLNDPDPDVRLAAAAAVLKLKDAAASGTALPAASSQ